MGSGVDTKYSDELAEVLVASGAGERVPANSADFSSLETFVKDDDGNMISRTAAGETLEYEWNDFNRLLYVKSSLDGLKQSSLYDASGIREQKVDKNGNSSLEFTSGIATTSSKAGSGSTAPTISYISGPGGILGAEIDNGSGSEFVFHLTDALSTVRAVVDNTGNVIRSFEFDEYGNQLSSSGSGAASPKTWVGGLSVNDDTSDSGMFNMGHRNYSAGVLGRFISRDPIGHAGGLNLYAYPTNPVTQVDPAGLQPLLDEHALFSKLTSNGFSPEMADLLILATRLVEENDPNSKGGLCRDMMSISTPTPKGTKPSIRGRTRQQMFTGKPVQFNPSGISVGSPGGRGEEAVVTAVATLANELYHFRQINEFQNGGGTEAASDTFMNQVLRRFQDDFLNGTEDQRIFDYDPQARKRAHILINKTITGTKCRTE